MGNCNNCSDNHHLECQRIDNGGTGNCSCHGFALFLRYDTGDIFLVEVDGTHLLSCITFFSAPVDNPHTADHRHEHTDGCVCQSDTGSVLPAFSSEAAAHDTGRTVSAIETGYRKESHCVRNIAHELGEEKSDSKSCENLCHKYSASYTGGRKYITSEFSGGSSKERCRKDKCEQEICPL